MLTDISLLISSFVRRKDISTLHEHFIALSSMNWSHYTVAAYAKVSLKAVCNKLNIICSLLE
jgi:hypothetical protein